MHISIVLLLLVINIGNAGVLFPDDGVTCRKHDNTSAEICLEEKSYYLSGETLCEWDDRHNRCDLRPPPSSFVFYIVVSLIISVVAVVPTFFNKYLIEEICVCRPILEDMGLITDKWFRVGVNRSAVKDSTGVRVGVKTERGLESLRQSGLGAARTFRLNSTDASQSLHDDNRIQRLRYFDFSTVEEELYYMGHFISRDIWHETYTVHLPWRRDATVHNVRGQRHGPHTNRRADATQQLLHLQVDGSAVGLTCLQYLRYRSARGHIKQKIIRSRRESSNIINVLTGLDDHSEGDDKDTALMQYFIVEQFSPFKRLSLRRHFFKFDDLTPDSISLWIWLGAWAYLILSGLFLLYWIINWAATHGPTTSMPWFVQFMILLVQEVVVNETIKVYIVDVLALELLRPQLALIKQVLVNVASSKIQKHQFSDCTNAIVQHVSGIYSLRSYCC